MSCPIPSRLLSLIALARRLPSLSLVRLTSVKELLGDHRDKSNNQNSRSSSVDKLTLCTVYALNSFLPKVNSLGHAFLTLQNRRCLPDATTGIRGFTPIESCVGAGEVLKV